MRPKALLAGAAVLAVLVPGAASAQSKTMKDGFYFGLGLGGAIVSGERGTSFGSCGGMDPQLFLWREGNQCGFMNPGALALGGLTAEEARDEMVRTDFGSGLALEMRLGYNILGYASIEAQLTGHGNLDADAGAGHVGGQVRLHPAQFFIPFEERRWDADLYGGFGYSIGGYSPDPEVQKWVVGADDQDDGKGWSGTHVTAGVAGRYMLGERISIGLDLKMMFPRWQKWFYNWDKDQVGRPGDSPDAFIFAPIAQVTFHL